MAVMGAERKEGGREICARVCVYVAYGRSVQGDAEESDSRNQTKQRKAGEEAEQPEEGSTNTRHDDNSSHNGSRTDATMKKETHKGGG